MTIDVELTLPANWSEIIKAGKYAAVARVLNGNYDDEAQQRLAILFALTDMTPVEFGKLLGKSGMILEDLSQLNLDDFFAAEVLQNVFPALDFIFDGTPFYENPLPRFTHKGIEYAGPGTRLHDQSGEEWMISQQAQVLYRQGKDMMHLRLLLAANYHRVADGQRTALDENLMLQDAEDFATLSEEILYGIMLWYNHCDNWWYDKFIHLFPQGDDNEALDGKEVRNIIFELSGNKIDQSWDVVKKRSRQDLFYTLDRLDQRKEAMKAALRK